MPISAKRRFLFLIISLLGLASCQPADRSNSATQTIIRVELSPTLAYLTPAIQACSLQSENLHIVMDEKPASMMGKTGADVLLMWGDRLVPKDMQTFRLGSDRLIYAAHIDNPLNLLTVGQAFFLDRGSLATWGEALGQFCPDCSSPDSYRALTIEPWQYSAGGDINQEIAGISLESPSAGLSRVWLAPDAKSMADVVTNNPAAIGWLPARWLNKNLKEIALEGLDPASQDIPVLAVTPSQPGAIVETWLHCLQSSYNN